MLQVGTGGTALTVIDGLAGEIHVGEAISLAVTGVVNGWPSTPLGSCRG